MGDDLLMGSAVARPYYAARVRLLRNVARGSVQIALRSGMPHGLWNTISLIENGKSAINQSKLKKQTPAGNTLTCSPLAEPI
jgi:hypothetical protein